MRRIYLFVLLTLFTVTVSKLSAEKPSRKPTEIEKQAGKIDYKLEYGYVLDILRKCEAKITLGRKNDKPLPTIRYASYSSKINMWLKYRWFIADTGLSRKWLKSVQELILYMRKTQGYIESAKRNKNTETAKYPQAVKYFDVAYERLVKLIEKPVKVSSKVHRKAKLNKVLWQKEMRKKYKIKENISTAEF